MFGHLAHPLISPLAAKKTTYADKIILTKFNQWYQNERACIV